MYLITMVEPSGNKSIPENGKGKKVYIISYART